MLMINGNTLDRLDDVKIGCSLDRLEMHLYEIVMSIQLGCNIEQIEYVQELRSILKQINPNSKVLEYSAEVVDTDLDKKQQLDKQKEALQEYTVNQETSGIDVTATVKCSGIDITLEYCKGKFNQAYTFVDSQMIDLTDKLKSTVQETVEDWKNYESIQVLGKLLIQKNSKEQIKQIGFKNTNHALVHFVVQQDFSQVKPFIKFVANDFSGDQRSDEQSSLWEQLNVLKIAGFEVPQKIKASNIGTLNLDKAVDKIINSFDNLNKTDIIEYEYRGVNFQADNKYIRESCGLKWTVEATTKNEAEQQEVKIKSIEWENCGSEYKAILKFEKAQFKDGTQISQLKNLSLRQLDRNNIGVGQVVKVQKNDGGTISLLDKSSQENK